MGQSIKTLIKTLFWWVVLPLGVLLLAVLFLLNTIPQTRMRAYAAKEIEQRIHRQVEIGPIRFGLRGLTVETLKFSEVPSFKKGILFNAKGIRLGWDLASHLKGVDLQKRTLTRSKGHLHINDFQNPHFVARDISLGWSLTDIDPTLAHLNGGVQLEQGEGALIKIDELMAKSPTAKVAFAPVQALINVDKLGIINLGLPDLKHWPLQGIHGQYTFKDGLMAIGHFIIESTQLSMATTGTVNLATTQLALETQLHTPKKTAVGAMDISLHISGTIAKPEVKMDSLKKKAFKATINQLLENPNLFSK